MSAPPGQSLWQASAPPLPGLPSFAGSLRTDVAVIGGGYTGLSTALHLAEAGFEVVLLEAGRIGQGASGRNGGQVGSGQRLGQDELERLFGPGTARALHELAEEAKAIVKARIERHAIACDLGSGILEAACRPADAERLARYAEKMVRDYAYPHLRLLDRAATAEHVGSSVYHGGLLDRDAVHLNPLGYARGLARAAVSAGARLFEESPVVERSGNRGSRLLIPSGELRADRVVLACNAHLGRLEPRIAGHILPITACQIATAPLPAAMRARVLAGGSAVFDTKHLVDYYRKTGDGRIVFGGGIGFRSGGPRDIRASLRPQLLAVFPELEDVAITHGWSGRVAITPTRLPQFARLTPNIWVAHGYSGHGVALATLAGRLIAEAIAGTTARFDLMAGLRVPRFPGGTLLRWPALLLTRAWFRLRDRL